jgi:hypothetical protein
MLHRDVLTAQVEVRVGWAARSLEGKRTGTAARSSRHSPRRHAELDIDYKHNPSEHPRKRIHEVYSSREKLSRTHLFRFSESQTSHLTQINSFPPNLDGSPLDTTGRNNRWDLPNSVRYKYILDSTSPAPGRANGYRVRHHWTPGSACGRQAPANCSDARLLVRPRRGKEIGAVNLVAAASGVTPVACFVFPRNSLKLASARRV